MGLHFAREGRNALGSVIATVFLAAATIVACAEGGGPDLGPAAVATVQESTEPEGGAKLPPSTPSGDEDSGETSSSGSSGSSGIVEAGADAWSDSGVDAAKDAAPDAAVCATVPPSNACGLSPQCGCAANQTCNVTNNTTGAVSCALAGTGALGSYCTTSTQCAKGLGCGYNACRPYCPSIGTACVGAGLGECTQVYDAVAGTPVPNSKVCTVSCDLRNPAAACGSNNCIFDTTIDATDCDKSGTKTLYAACTRYNDCAQGLACEDHPLFGFECEKWCRIGQNDCGVDTCTDVYGAAAPTSAGVKLGLCQ